MSDYAKGTVREGTIQKLLKRDCKILVDPKQNVDFYEHSVAQIYVNLKTGLENLAKKKQKAVKDYNWTWWW